MQYKNRVLIRSISLRRLAFYFFAIILIKFGAIFFLLSKTPVSKREVLNIKLNPFLKQYVKSNSLLCLLITPKRVTSLMTHLRVIAPGQHSSFQTNFVAMASRWQNCVDLISPRLEPKTYRSRDEFITAFWESESTLMKKVGSVWFLEEPEAKAIVKKYNVLRLPSNWLLVTTSFEIIFNNNSNQQ